MTTRVELGYSKGLVAGESGALGTPDICANRSGRVVLVKPNGQSRIALDRVDGFEQVLLVRGGCLPSA